MNHWKELVEFVLFIKFFFMTLFIESGLAYTKISGVASQYILWSGSLWCPVSSSTLKNKPFFSLVISELMSAFSTVQLDVVKNHIN